MSAAPLEQIAWRPASRPGEEEVVAARPGRAVNTTGYLAHQFGPDLAETGLTVQRDQRIRVAGMEAVLDLVGLIACHRLGRYGGDQADARRTQDAADFSQRYDWI